MPGTLNTQGYKFDCLFLFLLGATQDGGQMLEAFLGRPPSDAAYFKQFPAVNA